MSEQNLTKIPNQSGCETVLTDLRIRKQIMYLCFLNPLGLGGGVEWEADNCLRACRNFSAQYRWNTRGHFTTFIPVALPNPSLILQTLWLSRLISLWLSYCGRARREPLHCGTEQGPDSHAAGSRSFCALSLIDPRSCVWHFTMCVFFFRERWSSCWPFPRPKETLCFSVCVSRIWWWARTQRTSESLTSPEGVNGS